MSCKKHLNLSKFLPITSIIFLILLASNGQLHKQSFAAQITRPDTNFHFITLSNSTYYKLEDSFALQEISPFDKLFQKHAKIVGWDWKMIASIAYHESKFNPEISSPRGAYGLMQLMPSTMASMNISPASSIDSQVEAAVKVLAKIDNSFKNSVSNPTERIKFTLAAYNIGIGHVKDAQKLAAKHAGTSSQWETVADYLILKSNPAYYNDPIVKCGSCRGKHTVEYVKKVISLYEFYDAHLI